MPQTFVERSLSIKAGMTWIRTIIMFHNSIVASEKPVFKFCQKYVAKVNTIQILTNDIDLGHDRIEILLNVIKQNGS